MLCLDRTDDTGDFIEHNFSFFAHSFEQFVDIKYLIQKALIPWVHFPKFKEQSLFIHFDFFINKKILDIG